MCEFVAGVYLVQLVFFLTIAVALVLFVPTLLLDVRKRLGIEPAHFVGYFLGLSLVIAVGLVIALFGFPAR